MKAKQAPDASQAIHMSRFLTLGWLVLSFASGAVFATWKSKPIEAKTHLYAQPPSSIVICGITDHPCVTYMVSYHPPTKKVGDGPGEAFTDYAARTIAIASSKDRFEDVQALAHETYHAVLWERGFRDSEKWDLHSWIFFSEGAFSMVLHDNPALVQYILKGY
jgi:hypothetical protein